MLLSGSLAGQRAACRCPNGSRRNVACASVFSAKSAQEARVVGREWLETILSRFGPATDRAQNITTLDFEKPLLELDKRIKEVRVQEMRALSRRRPRPDALLAPAGPQGGRGEWRRRQQPDCRAGDACAPGAGRA